MIDPFHGVFPFLTLSQAGINTALLKGSLLITRTSNVAGLAGNDYTSLSFLLPIYNTNCERIQKNKTKQGTGTEKRNREGQEEEKRKKEAYLI